MSENNQASFHADPHQKAALRESARRNLLYSIKYYRVLRDWCESDASRLTPDVVQLAAARRGLDEADNARLWIDVLGGMGGVW